MKRRSLSVLSALCLGLLAALPLLVRGPSCGHDFDFHLQSWLAIAGAFHAGVLHPNAGVLHPVAGPISVAGANYGAGEPRFIFYPPLSWLLGAGLGTALPWTLVPAAFTALCLAGAAWSMHRFATRLCSPAGAVLAATLYALGPYLLFTAYERSAYGELPAAAILPALLDALTLPRMPVARAAVLLAALWYANAPAGVMGCYLVLLSLVFKLGQEWLERRAFSPGPEARGSSKATPRAAGALLLGCALAADYLLPAWYEQRFVAIRRAVGPGMRIEDSFLFGHTGEPFHDQVLRSASWIAVWTLGAGLLAGGLILLRRRAEPPSYPDSPRPVIGFCLLLLLACFLLQLRFSAPVWHRLPELAFLQFPWRLLLPASAAAALLLAYALDRRSIVLKLGLAAAFAAALIPWAAKTRYQPCDDEDNVPAQVALFTSGAGFEGTDEYAPAGTDNGEIQQGLPPVRLLRAPDADEGDDTAAPNPPWHPRATVAGAIQVESWSPEKLRVRVHPDTDAWAVLRRERWVATPVFLNGRPCGPACVPREDGLITVHLPAGQWSVLELREVVPVDVWIGRALSLAALLLLSAGARRKQAFMMGRK